MHQPSKIEAFRSPCVIVDIDRTIALPHRDRKPMDHSTCDRDEVNWEVLEAVSLYQTRYPIVLVSGRQSHFLAQTLTWLDQRTLHWEALFMRAKGDGRPDEVVKREIYEQWIAPRWRPVVVFDDRNKVVAMWRALGLTVFQVADGDF